jgi:hypothetical protein
MRLRRTFALTFVAALMTSCSSPEEEAYEACVDGEIERYKNDPYYEYEGNEDMYEGIAEELCRE